MLDIANTSLRRVLNTNWDLYQDRGTKLYYLRHHKSWLAAADLQRKVRAGRRTPARHCAPARR